MPLSAMVGAGSLPDGVPVAACASDARKLSSASLFAIVFHIVRNPALYPQQPGP